MKEYSKKKSGFIHAAVFILIGIIIGVFSSLITTASDKVDAERKMNAVSEYIERQCIRYDELAAEEAADSLYNVTDKAFAIRNVLDYSSDSLEEEIRKIAIDNRLSGIFITETGERSSFDVIAGFSDGGETAETWKPYFETFVSVMNSPFKSYGERVTADGYYYDCAVVARNDFGGMVLCYKRRSIETVEDDRFSVATLLKGFVFGSHGKVVVTDGNVVIAANYDGAVGMSAEDCPVVRKLREEATDENITRAEDGDVYYGVKIKSKNMFVYTFMPDSEVFARRSIILAYTFTFYMLFVITVVVARQRMLRKRRIEQERKDEAYRIEKEKLAREAIRANEAKTDFLRRMSHDIRTPINGIRGMVRIGEYYYDDPEKQKECREKIWNTSGYLLDIVNDILDMNKLTTSESVWKDESFVLSDLLEETESFLAVQAKEAGIALSMKTAGIKHNYLFGGKVQFKRIVTNLIGNAIKYNKPHGKAEFTCTEKYDKDGIAYFECRCSDTGIGMDEEFIKKMYEPFEREKQTESSNLEGVGLGLAIVKKLVDKAGWTIGVKSEKGKGTVFTLNVSFKIADEPKSADALPDVEKNKLQGLNILVAEDNELNFEIVQFMLDVAGANVIAAKDGKQAVDIFNASEIGGIDAILMDVMMPVKDGLSATREIRASKRADAESIPIVAMTASAFADDVENARTAGMNAHISKPIDEEKLINCILRLVKKRGGGYRK